MLVMFFSNNNQLYRVSHYSLH